MNVAYDLDKYVGSFNFRVSIDRIPQSISKVISVNGVATESDLVEYMLGPEPFVRKIPGRGKFTEVEIVRVYAGYDSLYNWRMMIEEGIDDLRTVKIEILAPDLKTVVLQMVLHNCWPHRWQLPNLDASSSSPATETITLACERVTQSISKPVSPAAFTGAVTRSTPAPTQNFNNDFWGGGRLTDAPEQNFNNDFWGGGRLTDAPEQNFRDDFWKGGRLTDAPEQNFRDDFWKGGRLTDAPEQNFNNDFWKGGRLTPAPEQNFNDDFWGKGPRPEIARQEWGIQRLDVAMALAAQLGNGPLDPNEESWDPPTPGDGKNRFEHAEEGAARAAATNTGPGTGRGHQDEADYGQLGDGPKGGRGHQAEADYGAAGTGPLDPNTEKWDGPEGIADPTAGRNGGDGTGPIGGRGAQAAADYGSAGGGPLDPNTEKWDGPEGIADPTAGRNGGDGSGPVGGRGAQAAADYGSGGGGPVGRNAESWGAPSAAEDPTAGRNGGGGSGPIGGRGAQAAADYGSPGDGPKSSRGDSGGDS